MVEPGQAGIPKIIKVTEDEIYRGERESLLVREIAYAIARSLFLHAHNSESEIIGQLADFKDVEQEPGEVCGSYC